MGALFLQPQCLIAEDEASIDVFSITICLALTGSRSSGNNELQEGCEVALLLVDRNTLVYQATCPVSRQLRFTVPAGVLQPCVLTAYVALSGEQGSVVLDSGRLLVLGRDAAAEVQALFSRTTARVQELLSIRPPPPSPPPAAASSSSSSSAAGDRPLPQRTRGLLSPLMATLAGRPNHKQGRTAQGSAQPASDVQPRQSHDTSSSPPDAATLYAYEHLIVPFLHLWAGMFVSPDDAAGSSQAAPLPPSGSNQQLQVLRLLVELELWACSLLVLGRYPSLAAEVQRSGFSALDEECTAASIVSKLRKVLQPGGAGDAAHLLALYGQQPVQPQQSQQLWAFQRQQQQLLLQQAQLQKQEQEQQQWLLQLQQQQQLQHQAGLHGVTQAAQQHAAQQVQQQGMHERRLLHQPVDSVLTQYKQMLLLQQQQQLQAGMQATPLAAPAGAGRSKSPSGSDESVESASEILLRLGLLQQARGEQEALADYMDTECHPQDNAFSLSCLHASSAWSEPLPVAQPAASASASRTAPTNVQPSASTVVQGPLTAAAAAQASLLNRPATQPVSLPLAAAASQPAHPAVTLLPMPRPATACGPCNAGSNTGMVQAAAVAPAAVVGSAGSQASGAAQGSLFGRRRKLSWEEEQPDPVPHASALRPRAMEVGWYPGSCQLPEAGHNPLLGLAGLAGAAAPFGPCEALPPAPLPGYAVPSCGGTPLDVEMGEPYTEPSYAAGLMCNRQLQQQPQPQQHQQQLSNALQQEQRLLQQQQQMLHHLLQQQQELQLLLQQQLQVQREPASGNPTAAVPAAAHGSEAGDSTASCIVSEFLDCYEDCYLDSIADDSCCKGSGSSREQQDGCCLGGSGSSIVKKDACCSTSRSSSDSGSSSSSSLSSPGTMGWPALLRLCVWGFQDPCLEASYVVFKNHGCSLLDATAGILCTAMLATSFLRSFGLQADTRVWEQLLTMLIYSIFFFLPYVTMQLHLQTFLKLREPLLVVGRNVSGIILAVMALGYLPMVAIWRSVIVNTLSLQIQNGFILPACQQVRLPAALMIAVVHVPADAIWLAAGRPFKVALVHSVIMQVVALAVATASDAWCRRRFLQRYGGVLRQRPAPALLQ